jgi:hypothetical protein
VQNTFFIKRRENFKTRHDGRIPKERRNNKITPKTNRGKRKEISYHQHKLDYRKEAEEGTTERPPRTALDLHRRTQRRLAHHRLLNNLQQRGPKWRFRKTMPLGRSDDDAAIIRPPVKGQARSSPGKPW